MPTREEFGGVAVSREQFGGEPISEQPEYDARGFTKASPKPGQRVRGSSIPKSGPSIMGALKSYDDAIYGAGGAVTDYASQKGASPGVAGGLGYGANVALQSIPMLFGGEGAKIAGEGAAVPLSHFSQELMGSALKPTSTQWLTGEGKTAVNTMLEKGLNVSEGGVIKLKEELAGLQKQVTDAISQSGATVAKSDVVKAIQEAGKYFKGGTGEIQDLRVIKDVVREFINAPSVKGLKDIPLEVAQRMKTLEYRRLDKAYGTLGDAEETARKGTARGLKEGIEQGAPEVASLNAAEQKIYQTLPVLERRAMMEINRNPAGLAALAHNPAAAAAMMLDKSSLFKSWLANRLNEMAKGASGFAADTARSGVALSEIQNQAGRQPEMTSY